MHRQPSVIALALLVVAGLATPSRALFHLTAIDEVLTSFSGSPSDQFLEMRMLFPAQTQLKNSVFAAFDSTGNYTGDLLVVPGNVTNSGTGTHWLVATSAFQVDSGLTADFTMPQGMLPTAGGMVCFGGGNGIIPQAPSSWDRADFTNYVDCVAYGTYGGPSNLKIGTPTSLNADGHALQRTGNSQDNAADFTCADSFDVQNNAGTTMSFQASSPCAVAPTPTPTPLPANPCVGDCNGDGTVMVNEIIVAVNIDLGSAEIGACPAFGGAATMTITDLVAAVNSALDGCPAAPASR